MQSLKEILVDIAAAIVDHPDDVTVNEEQRGEDVVLTLSVHPDDMGMVIGRQGRIAKEIRTVVRSYAQRTGTKVSVDIVD